MNNEDSNASMVLILMIALAAEGQKGRRQRQRGQHYLTRADLHPEPRYGTAWEAIYEGGNDKAFITTTGLTLTAFTTTCCCTLSRGIIVLFALKWDACLSYLLEKSFPALGSSSWRRWMTALITVFVFHIVVHVHLFLDTALDLTTLFGQCASPVGFFQLSSPWNFFDLHGLSKLRSFRSLLAQTPTRPRLLLKGCVCVLEVEEE
ncbi:hypothetical protein P3T76_015935 [Phytophthora citrophthora]|uniref:Amino acid transporter transmembrane domain-containing protein n=1 Tax=Phytophthora citrophthora TaxID=4793 RepID=A0AAD9FYK7_9STRA|nr:hypothetical protein P3T76_015935 [Phytophthora citrophthora]